MRQLTKLRTYARLGPANIARVAAYRLGLKTGFHPVQLLSAPVAAPPFYRAARPREDAPPPNVAWDEALIWFGWYREALRDGPPDWFANPFSSARPPDANTDWWRIPDFGSGDIKGLWELSRFDFVVAGATRAAQGDAAALERLNLWLADWARSNPPYKGHHWKCGQEASIRVMHLVTTAWMLGQDKAPERGLIDLLCAHLQRIAPTMAYAIGQQNNHGTSEAAALFIGGSFLAGLDARADGWARKGLHWLEERAGTLIERDGSFSQYSVTYHRLMLDAYSLAEAWRRHRQLPSFSSHVHKRLVEATDWLWSMTMAETGDAPNIGANDGARLLPLTGSDYRDFRPSIQLAAALFKDADAFGPGPWTAQLRWLGVPDGRPSPPPPSKTFDDGGYHILRNGRALAVLRYPQFRFRPSQADALHVDLWLDGENLLRDAGTFSYNAEGAEWFSSSAAHNTIQFDGRDQMPRIGRFLFGDWLRAQEVEPVHVDEGALTAAAAYTDAHGAQHHRTITLTAHTLVCRDIISGTFREAVLRWRLAPDRWMIANDMLHNKNHAVSISIEVDGKPARPTIGRTLESRYYHQQAETPIATIRLVQPASIVTKVSF